MRGRAGVAGFQPRSTAVHRSANKLWSSNSIFNLWAGEKLHLCFLNQEGILSEGIFYMSFIVHCCFFRAGLLLQLGRRGMLNSIPTGKRKTSNNDQVMGFL
jgi:hypothetical protein